MKYNNSNKPLICMQTQSDCYKGTTKMSIKGILWHSTGANNPTIKRYVQPSDVKPPEDTYTKDKWLEVLGKNAYGNDWNHTSRSAGLNCWIGKLADGTVTTVQTMPWNYRPWGCASGSKGSCNDGWIQFEICEDGLTDTTYFNAIYKEACEITAYLCKTYNINPKGTVTHNGVTVPTILCHQDSYKLGLGSNHGDIYTWFNKHGKNMDNVRKDVAALLDNSSSNSSTDYKVNATITYQAWDDVKNAWLPNVTGDSDYAGNMGNAICAIYANLSSGDCTYRVHTLNGSWLPEVKNRENYAGIFNQPIDGFMIKGNSNTKIVCQAHTKSGSWLGKISGYDTSNSSTGYAGILGKPIDAIRMYTEDTTPAPTVVTKQTYRVRTTWADSKSQKGAFSNLDNAKACCQSAGPGYNVFDNDGKIVYSYVAPVVAPTLSSISVTTKPAKTTYIIGETYDGTGLIVTATYSDKSTKIITGFTTSGFNSTKAGTVTINVTFEGKATSFTVTVTEPVKPVEPSPEPIPTPEVEEEKKEEFEQKEKDEKVEPKPVEPEVKPVEPTPVDPEVPQPDVIEPDDDNKSFVLSWLRKIIETFINVFKKG